MQVDYAVELGSDDETLEFPWVAPEGVLQYRDLKRQPESLSLLDEAVHFPDLREFLIAANSATGPLETAKCDAWATTEICPEEEIFGAPWKFGSYVDFLFTAPTARFSFDDHESLLKELTALLQRVPDIPASVEFLLRRCFYQHDQNTREGFYVTFYLFGYGADEEKAKRQWAIALKLVGNAIAQLSVRHLLL
jgi:hypothetical protein